MASLEDLKIIKACCAFWVFALGLFAIIAVPSSFKTMEQGKYSVQLQWMSQTILDQVITEPGLSYVGLGNFLIEFPSTFQTMYFVKDRRGIPSLEEFGDGNAQLFAPAVRGPIRARSADGLEMIVSFSFQWRLMPENLKDLYNILGNHMYKDEFVRFARAAVIESCSFFAADEYFVSRAKITDKIKEVLTAYFSNAELGLQMEIEGVQMREVDLPDDFDHEIANTQEQMQEADVAAAMRKEEVIAKERELLVAEQKVREVLQAAEAEAERVRLDNEAQITRLMMLQLKEAEANSEILQKFEDDPNPFDRLFEMMSLRAITNHDEKKIMLNM